MLPGQIDPQGRGAQAAAAAGGIGAERSNFSSTSNNALELAGWGTLWDVGSSGASYPAAGQDKVAKDFVALGSVASIIHGCEWLAYQLCSVCAATTKKASVVGSSSSTVSALSPNSSKFSTFLPNSSSSSSQPRSHRQELFDLHAPLWAAVHGGARELSKLADEGLALLRGEAQISCFHYLQQLAHIKFNKSLSVGSDASASSASVGLQFKSSVLGASAGVLASHVSQGAQGGHDADAVVGELSHHMLSFQDSILAALPSEALGVILSPLCSMMPKLIMRCLQHLCITNALSLPQSANASYLMGEHSSGTSLHNKAQGGRDQEREQEKERAKPLRVVVACQQTMSSILESSHFDVQTLRRLQDIVTDEFERVRRYVTLLDMPASELKVYIRSNFSEYSQDEFQTLWERSTSPSLSGAKMSDIQNFQNFDELWLELSRERELKARKN